MPRLKLPNGQYMRIPDNATQEDVDAAIASLPDEMRAAPAPEAAPAAVPAAAPPGAFSQVSAQGSSTAEEVPWYQGFEGAGERFKTAGRGLAHSGKGTLRAAKQIG